MPAGIVWAGPWLHVAATNRGFVTARVDDIMRVSGDDDHPDKFGLEGATCYSFGHRLRPAGAVHLPGLHRRGHEKLRYSFMSLDRRSDPPALIAGEYAIDPDATTRLARYDLDAETALPRPVRTGSPDLSPSRRAASSRCRARPSQAAAIT